MVEHYTLDPEIAAFVARSEAFYSAPGGGPSVAESRAQYDRMCAAFHCPRPAGLAVSDGDVGGVAWRRYEPPGASADHAVLYMHGGGFVLGGLDSHDSSCADLAAASGVTLLALDYRRSPEHRYPAALDDAQAAYAMLTDSGQRVVVAGDSAGGTLAAALCLRLRRLGHAMPIGQVLIYPALHPDPGRPRGTWRETLPMLTVADMIHYRHEYTGRPGAEVTDDPELAPLAETDFAGLPEAAVFAADIDPLAQDAADYVAALRRSGVAASLYPGNGLTHGFLRGRRESARIARCFETIAEAMARLARAPAAADAR